MTGWTLIALIPVLLAPQPAAVRQRGEPPLHQATIEEHPGRLLPLDLVFHDHRGRPFRLDDAFSGDRPVLLILADYDCRMLCSLVLREAARAPRDAQLDLAAGHRALTLSIDPRDRPEDAREARARTLHVLGAPEAAEIWPFLVGDEPAIRAVAGALGFGYAYDPASDQYAHPAVIFAITSEGRISSYIYGATFTVGEVEQALAGAAERTARAGLGRVLLRCFQYIPALRRYGEAIGLALRTGALLTMLLLGGWLARLWWRDSRREGSR